MSSIGYIIVGKYSESLHVSRIGKPCRRFRKTKCEPSAHMYARFLSVQSEIKSHPTMCSALEGMLPLVADFVNKMRTFSTRVCKALIRTERDKKRTQRCVAPWRVCSQWSQISQAKCEPSAHVCARFLSLKSEIKNAPTVVGAFFMARPGGFEPSTYRFVAGHSIH